MINKGNIWELQDTEDCLNASKMLNINCMNIYLTESSLFSSGLRVFTFFSASNEFS